MKIKEYLMITQNHKTKLVCNHSFRINKKFKKKNMKKPKVLVKLLEGLFYYSKLTEEQSYIIAYYEESLLGIFQLSHGTDVDCDMQMKTIFKFLLLVGADSFFICHNHPEYKSEMSQDDYDRTMELITLSHYLDIQFNGHIIVGKYGWREAKQEVIEMNKLKITSVNKYYERRRLCKED